MGTIQFFRPHPLRFAATVALLLTAGGCGWLGYACDGGVPEYEQALVREATSPSGGRARVVAETVYLNRGKQSPHRSIEVYLDHLPNVEAKPSTLKGTQFDGFDIFSADYERGQPAPRIDAEWLGSNEIVITYSSRSIVFCRQNEAIVVHCVERGFAAPQAQL